MKKTIFSILLVAGLLGLNACKKKVESQAKEEGTSCENVKWDYDGAEGPENWAALCTGFVDCDGAEQSPVNIETARVVEDAKAYDLEFSYEQTPVDILNNGHAIQFNVAGENTLSIGDATYKLLQFHYHTASEHTVDGAHFPMEVHFVHKGDKGLAVVGIFFEEGESNALLDNYLANFPTKKGVYKADKTIPLTALIPENLKYYHYDGSLTTPPCSEVVDWYVLQKPITASKEELAQMAKILHNNFRPVQPLNGRKVERN